MKARSGTRASAMPAMAPISEVFAVMPSVTMWCTPMIAPTTQRGAISNSEPRLEKAWMGARAGWRAGCMLGCDVAHWFPCVGVIPLAALPAAGCQP